MRVGVTLLFSCQAGRRRWGMLNDYVLKLDELSSLRKKANYFGLAEAKRFCFSVGENCAYIGIYDAYYVSGPLKTGAILGYSSYWSRKSRRAVVRYSLPDRKLEASLRKNQVSKEKTDYLLRAVYFLSAPGGTRNRHRAIEAWILVCARKIGGLVQFATKIAEGNKTKLKILRNLSDEVGLSNVEFCGFSDAREAFNPPVGDGRCFLSNIKKARSESEIRTLVSKRKAVLRSTLARLIA